MPPLDPQNHRMNRRRRRTGRNRWQRRACILGGFVLLTIGLAEFAIVLLR